MDRNDLAYWYPRLPRGPARAFSVPDTRVVSYPHDDLIELCDGRTPFGFDLLLERLRAAIADLGGPPVFLRTGHTSGKHEWRRTCALTDARLLDQHVYNLVEHSACVDLFGLPTATWVVREWLRLRHAFTAFDGMPVAREFRCFVVDGRFQCLHPYWPPDSIRHPSVNDWLARLDEQQSMTTEEHRTLALAALQAAEHLDGDWSVDFAQHEDGRWFLIDMAVASASFHWDGCAANNRPAEDA